MRCLDMGDLVGNALIALIEEQNCRVLSFPKMMNYGSKVAKLIGNDVTLLVNRDYKNHFLNEWSSYFELIHIDSDTEGVRLKDDKTADDLRERFVGYLPIDWLLAFRNPDALKVLFT